MRSIRFRWGTALLLLVFCFTQLYGSWIYPVVSVASLYDFWFTRTSGAALYVRGGTAVQGVKRFTIPDQTACSVVSAGADTTFWYLLNGTFVAGSNTATITCAGWTMQLGITAFPDGSEPLWSWPVGSTANEWDTTGQADWRTVLGRRRISAGVGFTITPNATTGVEVGAVDTTTTPQFTSGTATVSGNCTVGQMYIETDTGIVSHCTATNVWATAIVHTIASVAAKCQNGAAAASTNLGVALAPTPTCVTGANTLFATLTWPDADGEYYIQDSFMLPTGWTGAIDFRLKWKTPATAGDIVWQLATACVADGETGDPAWNAAQAIVDTAKGTTLQFNDAAQAGVTTTGCAAGETFFWKLFRQRTHASDTLADVADLISYEWTYWRAQ